jgi:hypothetical protein
MSVDCELASRGLCGVWNTQGCGVLARELRMDGWNLFRPEARSLKGLGTLNTYNSSVSAVVSRKPLSCPFPQNFPIPLAPCLDC